MWLAWSLLFVFLLLLLLLVFIAVVVSFFMRFAQPSLLLEGWGGGGGGEVAVEGGGGGVCVCRGWGGRWRWRRVEGRWLWRSGVAVEGRRCRLRRLRWRWRGGGGGGMQQDTSLRATVPDLQSWIIPHLLIIHRIRLGQRFYWGTEPAVPRPPLNCASQYGLLSNTRLSMAVDCTPDCTHIQTTKWIIVKFIWDFSTLMLLPWHHWLVVYLIHRVLHHGVTWQHHPVPAVCRPLCCLLVVTQHDACTVVVMETERCCLEKQTMTWFPADS